MRHRLYVLALPVMAALLMTTTGCDSSGQDEEEAVMMEVTLVKDLAADPFIGIAEDGTRFGTGRFTFFSLRENLVLAPKDSLGASWDIALRGTTILVNGGDSGPGKGGAQVVEGRFEDILTPPDDGYTIDRIDALAIPSAPGAGWYRHDPQTMAVTPIPDRVLLIRTGERARIAKLRILSYYKGAPDVPATDDEARYYTFEYALFPDTTP